MSDEPEVAAATGDTPTARPAPRKVVRRPARTWVMADAPTRRPRTAASVATASDAPAAVPVQVTPADAAAPREAVPAPVAEAVPTPVAEAVPTPVAEAAPVVPVEPAPSTRPPFPPWTRCPPRWPQTRRRRPRKRQPRRRQRLRRPRSWWPDLSAVAAAARYGARAAPTAPARLLRHEVAGSGQRPRRRRAVRCARRRTGVRGVPPARPYRHRLVPRRRRRDGGRSGGGPPVAGGTAAVRTHHPRVVGGLRPGAAVRARLPQRLVAGHLLRPRRALLRRAGHRRRPVDPVDRVQPGRGAPGEPA